MTPAATTHAPEEPIVGSDAPDAGRLSVARARLDSMDALRALACLWVVTHHFLGPCHAAPGALHGAMVGLLAFARDGWVGVNLFLVLSGFCLYYPLIRRSGDAAAVRLDLAKFAKRRAMRILPPYYATLGLVILLAIGHNKHHHIPLASGIHPLDLLLHLTMLFNLSAATFTSFSGTFWSLALESQLYVIFPILVLAAARFGLRAALLGAFLVSLAAQLLTYSHYGALASWPQNSPAVPAYDSVLARCFEFAAGMLAAALVARPSAPQTRAAAAICLLALPLCVWYTSRFLYAPLLNTVWGVEFAALIVLVCSAPSRVFETNPLLRGLTWIGTISYSIYLLHMCLIVPTMDNPALVAHAGNLTLMVLTVVTLALCVALSYPYHLLVERPFMPGRPRTDRQAEIAAAVSPAP